MTVTIPQHDAKQIIHFLTTNSGMRRCVEEFINARINKPYSNKADGQWIHENGTLRSVAKDTTLYVYRFYDRYEIDMSMGYRRVIQF